MAHELLQKIVARSEEDFVSGNNVKREQRLDGGQQSRSLTHSENKSMEHDW